MAESFGLEADRYDRARPAYPNELLSRVVTGSPGPSVLDVGCGTGIASRQFRDAGCDVLGVEPDGRMAAFARASGIRVEVSTFEAWEPAGRSFDSVVAAQSWHWVDPAVGASKAAQVLRPRGRLAVFGHVFEPPQEIAEAYAAALRRTIPDSPFSGAPSRRPIELYQTMYAKVAEEVERTGRFGAPEHWRFDWEQSYTREQWLELLPTTGGLTRARPEQLAEILADVGGAIDALGGSFTMEYTTLAVSAVLSADLGSLV